MSKFFVSPEAIKDNFVDIIGDEANHILRVLRMKIGDELLFCNSRGTDYKGLISTISEKRVTVEILSSKPCENEPPIEVILFQGLPKGDKMEYIIQKCVELGVSRIVPVSTQFAIAKMGEQNTETKKLTRWNRISSEAAKQCGRGVLPEVSESMTLTNAIKEAKDYDLVFVPYEQHAQCQEKGFRHLLKKFKNSVVERESSTRLRIGFFVGPEGGFSTIELGEFITNDFTPISLGKRILRTETASLAVLSILMYELGDI